HFEQKNFFVMRYFVDNTRRYLKKTGKIEPYEKELLRFFSKISKIPYAEFKDEFISLKDRLFPSEKESLISHSTSDYINFERWIEKNITSKTLNY
ncbi:MAG: hypothetical protein KDD99_01280, partial [Bacteroidetes bacterium]|nr:hypothetical protein [Bacteroidota bacterium]